MTAPTSEEFDYVVVGSGAGGGPVAANLAEAGHRVLLLEAGLDPEDDDYRVPAFHGRATEHPEMSWNFWVRHFDDPERQANDRRNYDPEHDGVLYPRAGTMGGCTAHNAMITMYPHDVDWDGIAELTGDSSWRATEMRQWFEKTEACDYRDRPKVLPANPWLRELAARLPVVSDRYVNRSRHGFDGWLHTTMAAPELAVLRAALRRPDAAGAGSEVRAGAGRRPLPALGHPRRLHRPQRHDHRVPARRRLGRHRGADR